MPDSSLPSSFILHPSSFLLSRPDRVGDVLIATACLDAIQRQLPGQRVVFVAREAMRPLLEGHPLLDGFIGLPEGGSFLRRRGAVAGQLHRPAGAALVHLHPDAVCQIAGWSEKIERRIGYKDSVWTDWTLTERFADRRKEGLKHEALYNFDLLAPLGIVAPALDSLKPRVHLAERWRESLLARLPATRELEAAPYIVINPTAHSPVHRWPPEHFAWLAHELRGRCECVVVVGEHATDPSVAVTRAALQKVLPGFLDLSGRLNLAELGWLLGRARLLVSRNTGTTHLAAAVDCPIVELFGRMEPAYGPTRWRSLGRHVKIVTPIDLERRRGESKRAFWQRAYASIPREAVLQAAIELLDATYAGRGGR